LGKGLKLTGGSFSGRSIKVPVKGVRPATNLVREAIFSTLFSFFERGVSSLSVLDLFAGTGSLGFEALSRGASGVTFVDSGRESILSIRKNLEDLGFQGEVIRSDVIRFLKIHKPLNYDLIFMDPPYRYKRCVEAVYLLKCALRKNISSVMVYERSYQKDLPDFGDGVSVLKRKKYGQTELLYYRIQK
jgi:16S rRNA (guanine966-N2)-methyltransferase